MSILLDALRKSEEQRRLGATPTLQTPESNADMAVDERRNWIPAVMLLLAAGAIAWIGAAQFHNPEPVPGPTVAAIEPLPTDIPVKAETTQESLDRLANSPEVPPPTTPVKDFAAEPGSTAVAGARVESEQALSTSRKLRSEQAVSVISAAAGEEAAAPALPAGEEPIAALVEDLSESDVAARPEADQLQPYATEPISYWQIPQSLRESMPEMRITVLVYSEKPQDRFLLINGKRLREKDEVSDGLVVEEIQRDRAIFTFRDYRFQVKS
ncbi:MAG: hypothetical protein EXR85_07400 [Xanthomonadales bacterium]|nr:hypothetical protein [Xanthomonadales bacterium]